MTTVSQAEFRRAVFDPNIPRPEGLTNGKDAPAGKRFDVYRNNVIVSLKEAMRTGFPVIEKLIGPENFNNLCGVFVRQHPPQDPRLVLYGQRFPQFLADFEPLQHLGYLKDVARLEYALRETYHAEDGAPLDGQALGVLAPEELAVTQITPCPATRVVASDWPIYDVWHFNMTEGAPQPRHMAQSVLITRPEFDPVMALLPKGADTLMSKLAAKIALGDALEQVHEDVPEFDFGETLTILLEHKAFGALQPSEHLQDTNS